jgi:hypothetical protein
MRIFARKTFEFENTDGEKVTVKMASFATVPDWAEKTPIFALALKDESIVVITNKEDEKKVEVAPENPKTTVPPAGK